MSDQNDGENNIQKLHEISRPRSTPQKTATKTPTTSSPSKQKTSKSPAKSTKKVCACGRGMACAGMTQAFRLLGDVRCHFVELPRYRENPPSFKYQFRNNMRASYIRNLQKCNNELDASEFGDTKHRRFVAVHHFQPQVVKAFYENPMTSSKSHRVPICITEHEIKEMGIKMEEEDRILSANGNPTGGFYFCPNYSPSDVHQDLKDLVRSKRLVNEAKRTPPQNSKEMPPKPKEVQFPSYSKTTPATPEKKSITKHLQDQRKQRELTPRKEVVDQHLQEQRNQRQQTPKKEAQPAAKDDSSTEEVQQQNDDLEEVPSKDFDDIVTNAEPSENTSNFDDLWKDERGAQDENDHIDAAQQTDEREGPAEESPPHRRKSDMSALTTDETYELNRAKSEDSEEKGDHTVLPDGGDVHQDDKGEDDEEAHQSNEQIEKSIEQSEKAEYEPIERELFPDAGGEREENNDPSDLDNDTLARATSGDSDVSANSSSPSKLAARNSDHPWDLSKYRTIELETRTKRSSAAFIDPTTPTQSKDESLESADSYSDTRSRKTPSGMDIIEETPDTGVDDGHRSNPTNDAPQQYLDFYDDEEEDAKAKNKYNASFALGRSRSEESEEESKTDVSFTSEGVSPNAIGLTFELPGSDPTLRIQVHNDLIALESRRRSDISTLLKYHKEQWQTARDILLTGVYSVEYAERLVSGFAQAGMLFADSLEAISEDRLLDDRGKTVKSSFLQNRLKYRRSTQEYSIENRVKDDDFGQSALLKALIESQLTMAKTMDESAQYLMDVMLPEMTDLKEDIQAMAAELDILGEGIIGQLITSESEVKNIWDVFDALVTGDLMEYSVHGSSHGSMHGGSFHSVGSTSLHGMIPDSASVVPNSTSPIKSKFKQLGTLGSIEDGWLVELIYKSAITCQRKVFEMAGTELTKLYKEICIFEEKRLQKLHPLMIAFVPRQRRLFSAFPDTLKGVLNDLVGMRIDEESLQKHIDDTLQNRSRDRLAGSQKHRSSIMNRSRLKTATDTPENVNDIERLYGSPFFSSMIVLSKVLELKPFGLGGIVKVAYKLALVVVTVDGSFHVFLMPPRVDASLDQSPLEAFRMLYPSMEFESAAGWRRKADITKQLTPSISLDLKVCSIHVSNIRNRELDVIQEKEVQQRNSFFGKKILEAVQDSGQGPSKCTLRLPTTEDAAELANMLTNTKAGFSQISK